MGEVIQFPSPAQPRTGRSREVRAALYAKAQWDAPMTLSDLTPGQRFEMHINAEWPEGRVPKSVQTEREKRRNPLA